MTIIIREMILEDVQQVQEVATKSWNATYEGIIPSKIQDKFLKAAYSDEMVKKRLRESFFYVAQSENKIVGFANFSPVNNEGEIELRAIYLEPTYQGKGIGSFLLQEGMKKLDGIRKIYINVEKENTIGRTFYEAKGFKVVKEFDDEFDGHMLKTVRMVLAVT